MVVLSLTGDMRLKSPGEEFLQRHLDESRELDAKINATSSYIIMGSFALMPCDVRELIVRKLKAMQSYSEILHQLIELIKR